MVTELRSVIARKRGQSWLETAHGNFMELWKYSVSLTKCGLYECAYIKTDQTVNLRCEDSILLNYTTI